MFYLSSLIPGRKTLNFLGETFIDEYPEVGY